MTYTYDSLNRLLTANGSGWGRQYGFDGFGNLLSKTETSGSGPSLSQSVNSANNWIVGGSYDANGNTASLVNAGLSYSLGYDPENRLAAAYVSSNSGNYIAYAYDAQNRRIWNWTGFTEDTFNNMINYTVNMYTPGGQKLGAYTLTPYAYAPNGQNGTVTMILQVTQSSSDTYFGSRRLGVMDQLGSLIKSTSPVVAYFPWGETKGASNPQDTWNFATYWQDSNTGLDYANNRYYSSIGGRFMTPDPSRSIGGQSYPQNWNRYAYVLGDPVNSRDPTGLNDCEGGEDCGNAGDPPPGNPGQTPGNGENGGPEGNRNQPFPKCNPTGSSSVTNQANFIISNYNAAAAVAAEADKAFPGLNAQNFNAADVLSWAAAESGYLPPTANPDSGLKSGNLDYFNLTAGRLWFNQVSCPSGANHYWACFGSFQGAAEAALFSQTQYGSYQGVANVSAGFVLGQQLGAGASITTAFQVMSNAVKYATNPNYGAGVQNTLNSLSGVLNCLKQNYASYF